VLHVGILVRDVEETARRLEKLLGIAPWQIFEPDFRDLTVYGKPARYKVRIALAMAGPVQVELIQVLLGDTVYDEFVRRKGYGLHHLGLRTSNIERSVKKMEANGFRVIQSGNRPGVSWAYFSPEESTGVILEFLEYSQSSPKLGIKRREEKVP
jgi:methylmalonyl-CoA/ethylmalonyl-CoA epimerase